jgi:tetratricopeptide (TPR) repeat protein
LYSQPLDTITGHPPSGCHIAGEDYEVADTYLVPEAMSPAREYTPEDKNQALVLTQYGRGLVIRSNRDDGIREVQLTEWEMASSRRGVPPNAMLYTPQTFPSVKPLKGDNVVCQWGRGIVQEIRRNGTIVIQLSSWRLANRSLVKCYLEPSSVQVVRKKTKSEMDVYERVELANEFKALANSQFAHKMYEPAVVTYSKAVDAVRYVQHDATSSNEVRADLIVAMITCSNNAGTCSVHLHKWDQAIRFAKNALVLIDALYPKRGSRIHTVLNRDGHPDSQIFGEWRVKSYLIMARAHFERKDYDTALETLKGANAILNEYEVKTPTLLSQEKEAIKLKAHCDREEKIVKRMEKKRAKAMFGGGTSMSKSQRTEQAKNGEGNSQSELDPTPATPTSPSPLKPTIKPSKPIRSQNEYSEPEMKTPQNLSKKVSFSVPEAKEFEEDEAPWYEEHMEAMILTAVVGLIAVGVSVLIGARHKQ